MAEIQLANVTLAFPMLGSGMRRQIVGEATGAGAIIRDDGKRGRSVVALNNISLSLQNGDRVGLIGRNGSGKSTLLRVMSGIYEPLEGEVSVRGKIASMFNVGLGVRPEATGYRNIVLTGLVAGYSRAEIEAMTPDIVEFAELGPYLNLPLRTYSNGMAMRLKFACATAFQPDILLMDEWLGAGDAEFREKAEQRMTELVEKAGILVLASHSDNLIQRMCNKVLWLDGGVMRAFGPTAEVMAQYAVRGKPAPAVAQPPTSEPVVEPGMATSSAAEPGD